MENKEAELNYVKHPPLFSSYAHGFVVFLNQDASTSARLMLFPLEECMSLKRLLADIWLLQRDVL